MRSRGPLAVDIPSPERDKPAWVKVGVIAAVGFVIGIAWPRLVGVRLGPSAPGEAAAQANASASVAAQTAEPPPPVTSGKQAAVAPPPSAVASSAPAAALASKTVAGAPSVRIPKGHVLSCKTSDGDTKKGAKECGNVAALDAVVLPRLRNIASCAAAEGQTGKVSVVVTADFAGGKLGSELGKSSTVGNADAIGACVKKELAGVQLRSVAHDHPRYTVSYNATLGLSKEKDDDATAAKEPKDADRRSAKQGEADKPEAPKETATTNAPGEATVAWEVALVRDVPKTGEVVARLPRGTKVKVGALKDGWYGIKYGDGGEGFVYRAAIGR